MCLFSRIVIIVFCAVIKYLLQSSVSNLHCATDSTVDSNWGVSGYKFGYDQNGDLIKWTRLGYSSLAEIDYGITDNPFKSIAAIYYFIEGDFIGFSAHAPTTFQPGAWNSNLLSYPVNYNYEFNSNGTIQRIRIPNIPAIPIVSDIDFFYE